MCEITNEINCFEINHRRALIAPSILSADFANLKSELFVIEETGADWVHLDVMDGHFVPNMTFGPPIISKLRHHSKLPFDVHLMIENPHLWLKTYKDAGADRITIHLEATPHAERYLSEIKKLGAYSGISINPQTPICGLEYILPVCDQVLIMTVNPGFGGQTLIEPVIKKIKKLRKLIDNLKLPVLLEVDGGIDMSNYQKIFEAGADVLVMGSAFFNSENKKELVRKIHNLTSK